MRRRASEAIGDLARQLHGARVTAAAGASTQDAWLDSVAELLHAVGDHLVHDLRARLDGPELHLRLHRVLEMARDVPLGDPVLVHGDLHPSNLLFADSGAICGLIDFDLTCIAPAAFDFRHLAAFDEEAFLAGYGRYQGSVDQACWAGHFTDLFWTGFGVVARHAVGAHVTPAGRRQHVAQFEYLLQLCEDARLRTGPAWRRSLRRSRLARPVADAVARGSAPAAAPRTDAQVAVIVPTWNHCETTTEPCLRALRWFTDVPYRIIFVDNDSRDGTRALLGAAAASDPRVEVLLADHNLGWARGSLAGMERLRTTDSHVLLLNSDVLVTPGWLRKLLAHLPPRTTDTMIVPDEYIRRKPVRVVPLYPSSRSRPGRIVRRRRRRWPRCF